MRGQRIECRPGLARLVLAVLVGIGLAGCAGDLVPKSGDAPAGAVPYEGTFTGEFVDGKPLVRFPTIEVVGSRVRVAPGT